MATPFNFQSFKEFTANGELPEAVQKTLAQFQAQAANNMKHAQGTVVTTVVPADEGFFVVVLAGPFVDLDVLREAVKDAVPHQFRTFLRQSGIE